MLSFHSGSAKNVNSERVVDECMAQAFGGTPPKDCRAVIFISSMGHNLARLGDAIKRQVPEARVYGASAGGVTGRAGIGETMHDVAIMAICGPADEVSAASIKDIFGHNAYEKGVECATKLKEDSKKPVSAAYLLCPGIDIANDLVFKGFSDVFGMEIPFSGGTASDNMRGITNFQYCNGTLGEHDAWVVAFCDPTLHATSRPSHGLEPYGEPMVVTKVDPNVGVRILELDNRPAWEVYTQRLGLPLSASMGEVLTVGALAERLPEDLAASYDSDYIFRAITKVDEGGAIYYPVTCKEGLKLWLNRRDEERIFNDMHRCLDLIKADMGEGRPVVVFQTDCLARGRRLFNQIMKDELIGMVHGALSVDGVVPPWLGMYAFGEYAMLGGKNTAHNYTASLLVLYRNAQ